MNNLWGYLALGTLVCNTGFMLLFFWWWIRAVDEARLLGQDAKRWHRAWCDTWTALEATQKELEALKKERSSG